VQKTEVGTIITFFALKNELFQGCDHQINKRVVQEDASVIETHQKLVHQ